ncbi:hypothetical protein SDC9_166194 [bioreactor metagenome]|uniref:Uncharacterized protein n=1 Tax=bioreactor metagenome TaxID=1076179 RepID=A0A645FYX7_9ZZZZ
MSGPRPGTSDYTGGYTAILTSQTTSRCRLFSSHTAGKYTRCVHQVLQSSTACHRQNAAFASWQWQQSGYMTHRRGCPPSWQPVVSAKTSQRTHEQIVQRSCRVDRRRNIQDRLWHLRAAGEPIAYPAPNTAIRVEIVTVNSASSAVMPPNRNFR